MIAWVSRNQVFEQETCQNFVKRRLESHLLGKKFFLGATREIGKNGKWIFRILPSIRVVWSQSQS